jgi:hypothetical protein
LTASFINTINACISQCGVSRLLDPLRQRL